MNRADNDAQMADLVAALRELSFCFWSLGIAHQWSPTSSAGIVRDRADQALELQNWPGVSHLVDLLHNCLLMLAISANDHLQATADLLSVPPRLLAARTAERGLLEASARTWYLLDPEAEALERSRRLLNDLAYSAHEVVRLRTHADVVTTSAEAELALVVEVADSLGFGSTSGGRESNFFGSKRPPSTKLIAELIGRSDGVAYRVTSAVSHANLTGIDLAIGQGAEIHGARSEPDGRLFQSADRIRVEYDEAALSYANMARRFAKLYGWSTPEWEAALTTVVRRWVPDHEAPA